VPSKVSGITTVGLGVPVVGWLSMMSNSSTISPITLATAPTAGTYEVHYALDLHTPCSTGNQVLTLAIGWTGASSRSETTGGWQIGSSQSTASFFSGVQPIVVASGNVTITPALVGACASGTATWDGSIWMTRIN
jgi:hypothetical protein